MALEFLYTFLILDYVAIFVHHNTYIVDGDSCGQRCDSRQSQSQGRRGVAALESNNTAAIPILSAWRCATA